MLGFIHSAPKSSQGCGRFSPLLWESTSFSRHLILKERAADALRPRNGFVRVGRSGSASAALLVQSHMGPLVWVMDNLVFDALSL